MPALLTTRIPGHVRRRPLAFLGRSTLRALLALLMASAVTVLGCSGTFLTTASAFVNLLLEPLILLLMPGLICGMILSNIISVLHRNDHHAATHDYTTHAVIAGSLVFYSFFFFHGLWWWARRRAARSQTASDGSR